MEKILNITNGDALTDRLQDLNYPGEYLVWSEMLCEGPTSEFVGSQEFFEQRSKFFNDFYDLIFEKESFEGDLQKLDDVSSYDQIILWFEYDLFCHINMLAVISLLIQKHVKLPTYLVCSGFTSEEHKLTGLAELSEIQLEQHYKDRILLKKQDKEMAHDLWKVYCGTDHNLLKPYILMKSSFKYLSACLKAHLLRFPDSRSGFSNLEYNLLKILENHTIKSEHHLLGYLLNYQGYYGYGDTQLKRIIQNMSMFYTVGEDEVKLNSFGKNALKSEKNLSAVVHDNLTYGGVNKLDFQYSRKENKLIKPVFNVT